MKRKPPATPGHRTTTFRLDPEVYQLLNEYATATRRSLNAALNTHLETTLREWKAGLND